MKKQDEKTFAMLCHLSAFAAFIIPLGCIIGPLVFWLIKKDESKIVDYNGKSSLNFQISMMIYMIISAILIIIAVGIVLLIALGIFWIVMVIIASVKANEGKKYTYPLAIPFIK